MELAVPVSTTPGGVPARLSTAASGGGGGIWRNEIVENYLSKLLFSLLMRG